MRLGPSGIGLNHCRIAKAVDDDTGQAIGLGMDQSVKGRLIKPIAQRLRPRDPRTQPGAVNHRLGITVQHPRDDLGFDVDRHQPQRAALGVLKHGQRAGGQRLRAPIGDQLIGIDPGKAVPNGARLGLGAQAHDRARIRTGLGRQGAGGISFGHPGRPSMKRGH